jgi:MoaA/NifB/PqqE/SkfB family radical SAM enzyme
VIDEFKKAFAAREHAGISSRTSLPLMMLQAAPIALSLSGRARPPLTLYWSVNSVCNLRCKMCDVGSANPESNFFANLRIDGKLREIPIDRFKSVIDEVAPSRPMVAITSTEPLMYKPLPDAIAHCTERGLETTVTTGGYLLPQRAEDLAVAGLTRLAVSIDGPPTIHNEIRGRKDSFERSTEGIRKFREASRVRGHKSEVLVSFTVTNMNFGALVDFYKAVKDSGADRVNFTYMNFVTPELAEAHNAVWGDKYRATVNCLNEDTNPARVDVDLLHSQIQEVKALDADRRLATFQPDWSKEDLHKFFHSPNEFMSRTRCVVTWFIAEIIASGEVIPYTRCYHVPLGNINEQSFTQIWNGPKARAWRQTLRRQKRFPACTRCDFAY